MKDLSVKLCKFVIDTSQSDSVQFSLSLVTEHIAIATLSEYWSQSIHFQDTVMKGSLLIATYRRLKHLLEINTAIISFSKVQFRLFDKP